MKTIHLIMLIAGSLLTLAPNMRAETTEERDQRMGWWREARLGMFVHWGLYSAAEGNWDGKPYGGGVEWIQQQAGVTPADYEARLKPLFVPKPGFAKEWARLAKAMGAKYVVFTSKHHEGFALHDSKFTTFDAKDFTGRDLFKEIVQALRAEGLRVGVYHSVIDWHHPDFRVHGTGLPHPLANERYKDLPDPDSGRQWNRYVEFLHNQAGEITSNYGKIDILWWDWSSKETQGESWRANELIELVRKNQPGVIMNNRLFWSPNVEGDNLGIFNITKGDFTTPEQHIPATGMKGVDWESCMTLNDTWGYSDHDLHWKTAETLIHNTVDIASKGGNYLINAGPTADGTIPEAIQTRLLELGRWMAVYGDAIYGTQANPVGAVDWGRITARKGRLYLHIFAWPANNQITVSCKSNGTPSAWMMSDPQKAPLRCSQVDNTLTITLKPQFQNPYASVIVLEGTQW